MFRYMNAGDQEANFAFDSNSTPILARPITNITSGTATADTQLIAFPAKVLVPSMPARVLGGRL